MEGVRDFLESSTIHGLVYISTTKRLVKLLWFIVVISGFTVAGTIIYQSFQDWSENPITTTIDTRPATELTFPKVTVCPPKDTFTDLNYDLMTIENMTLDDGMRKELTDYALELMYDNLYAVVMNNMSKIEVTDRYHNWYHGYTYLELPAYDDYSDIYFRVYTSDISGSISTKYFGERFDADKVVIGCKYLVKIYPLQSFNNDPNVTFHFEIERMPMKDLKDADDLFYINSGVKESGYLNDTVDYLHKKYTMKEILGVVGLEFERKLTREKVREQKLNLMPGFKAKWYFTGLKEYPKPIAKFYSQTRYPITRHFVRKCSAI